MSIELIIQVLSGIVIIYLAFFKSYFSEKGKSVALKQDLADLTKEVEGVKSEFTKEHELLKTDFQRLLSNEISYQDEVRFALIEFHSLISQWIYSILEFGYGDYDRNNFDILISNKQDIAGFYAKSGVAKSRIELLVDDKEIVEYGNELFYKTLAFHYWAIEMISRLQWNCQREKSLIDEYLSKASNSIGFKEFEKKAAKEEKDLKKERKELFKKYYDKRNEEYKKILPIELKYSDKIKQHLRK